MRVSIGGRGEARIGRPLGLPGCLRERRPLGIVADRDHAPLVVARARVHTPRRAERAAVSLRVDRAGHEALLEDELREVVDDRVGLRDANVASTTVADARQRRERAEPRRELVGEEDRVLGEVAVGVGIAPERRLRADAARVRAEAAPPTPRSPVAEQLAAHHDDVRIGAAERLRGRARGCRARPGPRFSITTSLTAMSRRINSRPSGDRRSIPRLRLLRLIVTNCDDMFASPPNTRLWSGKARLSTRITSAPWSRRSLPVSGPAMSCVNSRTRRAGERALTGVRHARATANRGSANGDAPRPSAARTASVSAPGVGAVVAEADALVVELEVAGRAARPHRPSTVVVAKVPRSCMGSLATSSAGDSTGVTGTLRCLRLVADRLGRRAREQLARRSPAITSGWRLRPP